MKSTVAYLQLALFSIFVLMVAWFGGEQLIVRADPLAGARPRPASAAAISMCAPRRRAGLPSSSRLPPRSTTWRRSSPTREEELRIANEHLEELASLDGLTGLANRRGFDRQLEQEWQRAGETHTSRWR